MHGSTTPPAERQSLARATRRVALAVVALLSALALSGCGGSGSASPAPPSPSSSAPPPHATLSQSDSVTLAFMTDTVTRIDANAAAAADFLTSLETAEWLKLTEQKQLAVLSDLESLSQSLSRTITAGYPKAEAADLKAAEKGPFTVAVRACSDYISEAANAASNLLYLPSAQVRVDTPRWVKRITDKADPYAPARERLRTTMAALQARYGS
jgi:hypothetical protein